MRVVIPYLIAVLLGINVSLAEQLSPVGSWKIMDPKTHEPRTIIQIREQGDNLVGKIQKIFFQNGESSNDLCQRCKGEMRNQPVLGLDFMWGFKKHGATWKNGRILDPSTGKIYKSRLQVVDGGKALKVRGYIALPIFGRNQIWQRVER